VKAIVLAAGQGTRLMPLTQDKPKCLVPLKGTPLIEYQLEALRHLGVEDVTVVSGYRAEALDAYGLRRVHNPEFATTNMVHSLFCAEKELSGDVILSYGDIIFEPRVLESLEQCRGDIAVVVDRGWQSLWQLRMEDVLSDAETMKIDDKGHIRELGKKPRSLDEIQGQYIGLMRFSGRIWNEVRRIYHALAPGARYDGRPLPQMFMTSFLQILADEGIALHAALVDHGWLEVDTVRDKEAYERLPLQTPLFDFTAFHGRAQKPA
jgi:L-glutamine-phosphate cytidylyltransferase